MASTSAYFTVLQFSGKSLLSNLLHAHSQTHLRMLTFTCPSRWTRNCGLHERTGSQECSFFFFSLFLALIASVSSVKDGGKIVI